MNLMLYTINYTTSFFIIGLVMILIGFFNDKRSISIKDLIANIISNKKKFFSRWLGILCLFYLINYILLLLDLHIVIDTSSILASIYTHFARLSQIKFIFSIGICLIKWQFTLENFSLKLLHIIPALVIGYNFYFIMPYVLSTVPLYLDKLNIVLSRCSILLKSSVNEVEVTNLVTGFYKIFTKLPMVGKYINVFLSYSGEQFYIYKECPFKVHYNTIIKNYITSYSLTYISKFTPVKICIPFSSKVNNYIHNLLVHQTTGISIFATNICYFEFKSHFYNFMQKSENVLGFFNTMSNLKEVKFILSGNSTLDFKWIGKNIVKMISNDNGQELSEFRVKDLVKPNYMPAWNIPSVYSYSMTNQQLEFYTEKGTYGIQLGLDSLTTKSSQIDSNNIFANTDPNKVGYNCNLQIYMESYMNYDNSMNQGESSRQDLIHNRGTNSPREESHIEHEEDKSIQIKIYHWEKTILGLNYDLDKLNYTEYGLEWKVYLKSILTKARLAFIQECPWGVEEFSFKNILFDYEDLYEQRNHKWTLRAAIDFVKGDDIEVDNISILSNDFIESLSIEPNRIQLPESESIVEEITDNTKNVINYNEPLTNEEIQYLIDDLRERKNTIESTRQTKRHRLVRLSDLKMYFQGSTGNIVEGADIVIHPLLTKLRRNNEDFFSHNSRGTLKVVETPVERIIGKLEELISNCNYNEPLTNEEIESLITDLEKRRITISNYFTYDHVTLTDLKMYLQTSTDNIVEGTDKVIHPLLTKLRRNNEDFFCHAPSGYIMLSDTTVASINSKLEQLKKVSNN